MFLHRSYGPCRIFFFLSRQGTISLRKGSQVYGYYFSSLGCLFRSIASHCFFRRFQVRDVRASVGNIGSYVRWYVRLLNRRSSVYYWYRFLGSQSHLSLFYGAYATLAGGELATYRFGLASSRVYYTPTSTRGLVMYRSFYVEGKFCTFFQRAMGTSRVASIYRKGPWVVCFSSVFICRQLCLPFAFWWLVFLLPSANRPRPLWPFLLLFTIGVANGVFSRGHLALRAPRSVLGMSELLGSLPSREGYPVGVGRRCRGLGLLRGIACRFLNHSKRARRRARPVLIRRVVSMCMGRHLAVGLIYVPRRLARLILNHLFARNVVSSTRSIRRVCVYRFNGHTHIVLDGGGSKRSRRRGRSCMTPAPAYYAKGHILGSCFVASRPVAPIAPIP